MSVEGQIAAEMRALRDEVHALRDEIRGLRDVRRPARCTREDLHLLRRLLPAIAGRLGSESFTVGELLAVPVFRALVTSLTPRQLGRLLLRAVPVDGLAVERIGADRSRVALWRVVAAPMPVLKPALPSPR
jgi:hypothetical protein